MGVLVIPNRVCGLVMTCHLYFVTWITFFIIEYREKLDSGFKALGLRVSVVPLEREILLNMPKSKANNCSRRITLWFFIDCMWFWNYVTHLETPLNIQIPHRLLCDSKSDKRISWWLCVIDKLLLVVNSHTSKTFIYLLLCSIKTETVFMSHLM